LPGIKRGAETAFEKISVAYWKISAPPEP